MMADRLSFAKSLSKSDIARQLLLVGFVLGSALTVWKVMVLVSDCDSPIVVVLSGSMEPGFSRGDLVFLRSDSSPFEPGDIVVFKLKGRDIPIIHRALRVHEGEKGGVKILTKGDANFRDDVFLYDPAGRVTYLKGADLIGKAWAYIPYVGMVTIWITDYPILKYVMLLALALVTFLSPE